MVVVDEVVARARATALKLKVTGTLGLLADGIERKWCTDDECLVIVRRLRNRGFRIRRCSGANETFKEYFASFSEQGQPMVLGSQASST